MARINKLLKYSDKPIEILSQKLYVHRLLVLGIVEMSEEVYYDYLTPFRLTKQHIQLNIISQEEMETINKEFNSINELINNLTDELISEMKREDLSMLWDIRNGLRLSKFSSCTEEEFQDMSLLEVYIRSYAIKKFVGGITDDEIVYKSIRSIEKFCRIECVTTVIDDKIIKDYDKCIDENNMCLIIDGITIDGITFDLINEWVLLLCNEKKAIIPPEPKFPNDRVKQQYEKMKKKRAELEAKKRELNKDKPSHFEYALNYVIHLDNGDYDKVMNYTVWQFFDRFNNLQKMESYKTEWEKYCNDKYDDPSKLKLDKHWSELDNQQ